MSSSLKHRLGGIILFALAFGFVEAVIVIYLRTLYVPSGKLFPIDFDSLPHLTVEVVREFFTLLMLMGPAWAAGKTGLQRFAFYSLAFGIWDIFYYVALKIFLNWPSSLFAWDILFLIPAPWSGPVLSPCLVSLALIICSVDALKRMDRGVVYKPQWFHWTSWIMAAGIILLTYFKEAKVILNKGIPQDYNWWLFIFGLGLGVAVYLLIPQKNRPG